MEINHINYDIFGVLFRQQKINITKNLTSNDLFRFLLTFLLQRKH